MIDSTAGIDGISALADSVRRSVYEYVVAQQAPVGRDQTARALGLPRHQATFHLERLERAGLLRSEYARLSGRSGPGAGRPAKVYRRCPDEIAVSLPGRQYALAGELLATAVERALQGEAPLTDALTDAATRRGEEIARSVDPLNTAIETASAALHQLGYEPRLESGQIVPTNCPFHYLAREHTALVCGMNHALLTGLCHHVGSLRASLDPGPDRCCVIIESTDPAQRTPGRVP